VLPFYRADYERGVGAARAGMDERSFAAEWARGGAMTLEEAVDYALGAQKPSLPPSVPVPREAGGGSESTEDLTRREEEVAVLVARGLSNRRIAEELTVSEHTAATHVRNILKKLGLDSRTRIAAWMRDRQPLP
jgi:non-specific serine/threonine protein kinase